MDIFPARSSEEYERQGLTGGDFVTIIVVTTPMIKITPRRLMMVLYL